MPQTAIIVPCRLESTRFPRKLLHRIHGKPLVLWVAERITAQAPSLPLYFAVDDELLAAPLRDEGFKTILTGAHHQSGTDRIAEANRSVKAERVINIQADEPLVSGRQIEALVNLMAGDAPMATLATRFTTAQDFLNPNQVKVVFGQQGNALYFSRAPLPHPRDVAGTVDDAWVQAHACHRHLGLYAYRADLLEKIAGLPPGRYELIEKLEQLRVMENGYTIAVGVTDDPTIGVDTPEDAEKFEALVK